jgi:hypothetical protein
MCANMGMPCVQLHTMYVQTLLFAPRGSAKRCIVFHAAMDPVHGGKVYYTVLGPPNADRREVWPRVDVSFICSFSPIVRGHVSMCMSAHRRRTWKS